MKGTCIMTGLVSFSFALELELNCADGCRDRIPCAKGEGQLKTEEQLFTMALLYVVIMVF